MTPDLIHKGYIALMTNLLRLAVRLMIFLKITRRLINILKFLVLLTILYIEKITECPKIFNHKIFQSHNFKYSYKD